MTTYCANQMAIRFNPQLHMPIEEVGEELKDYLTISGAQKFFMNTSIRKIWVRKVGRTVGRRLAFSRKEARLLISYYKRTTMLNPPEGFVTIEEATQLTKRSKAYLYKLAPTLKEMRKINLPSNGASGRRCVMCFRKTEIQKYATATKRRIG